MRIDCGGPVVEELLGVDDLLDRHEAPLRAAMQIEVVEVRDRCRGTGRCRPGRRGACGSARRRGRARASRRAPRRRRTATSPCASVGVEAHHVGAEADARRQERHAPRRGLQAEEEHALVELGRLRPRRTGGRCGSAARARSSRARRTSRRPCAPCPPGTAARRRGRRRRRCVRSRHGRAAAARGRSPSACAASPSRRCRRSCRRGPRPTISSIVTRLSGTGTSLLDSGRGADRRLRPRQSTLPGRQMRARADCRDRSRRAAASTAGSCSSPAAVAGIGRGIAQRFAEAGASVS